MRARHCQIIIQLASDLCLHFSRMDCFHLHSFRSIRQRCCHLDILSIHLCLRPIHTLAGGYLPAPLSGITSGGPVTLMCSNQTYILYQYFTFQIESIFCSSNRAGLPTYLTMHSTHFVSNFFLGLSFQSISRVYRCL